MLRYMENLVGRKVRIMYYFTGVKTGKEYEIVKSKNGLITIVEDSGKEQDYCVGHIDNGNLKLVPYEWKPIQGEKVFAGQNENECIETVYVSTFNGWHYTTSGTFKHIKPFKEEIKVIDWYLSPNGSICKLKSISATADYKKITDEELIKKLNEL